jgi:nucleoside 2-deoxyribosyltransferase
VIIYLSGPITNTIDYKEKFKRAEKKVQVVFPEAKVVNPAKVKLPGNSAHEDYMNIDYMFLDLADAICMLDGWQCSKGACMEYGYAKARDLLVLELDGI